MTMSKESCSDKRSYYSQLSFGELDYLCQGLGHRCIHCGNTIPENGGVCPSISDTALVHEVARKLHTEVRL